MDFSELLSRLVLPGLGALVLLILIWLIAEVIMVVRRAKRTITEINETVQPTLKSAQKIMSDLEPVVEKLDPAMDRVTLMLDAANLEMMRVDQILEDVSEVTSLAAKTSSTVEKVTNAPLYLVTSISDGIQKAVNPRVISDKTAALAEGEVDTEKSSFSAGLRGWVSSLTESVLGRLSGVSENSEGRHAAPASAPAEQAGSATGAVAADVPASADPQAQSSYVTIPPAASEAPESPVPAPADDLESNTQAESAPAEEAPEPKDEAESDADSNSEASADSDTEHRTDPLASIRAYTQYYEPDKKKCRTKSHFSIEIKREKYDLDDEDEEDCDSDDYFADEDRDLDDILDAEEQEEVCAEKTSEDKEEFPDTSKMHYVYDAKPSKD